MFKKAIKRMEVVADLVDQELIPTQGVKLDANRVETFWKSCDGNGN